MQMHRHLAAVLTGMAVAGVVVSGARPISFDWSAPAIMQDTTITPAMLALGEKIFQGRAAGGLCFSCHGSAGKGTKGLAPNLTDATWLHGDGSYNFIVSTIQTGVPKPKEAAAPMPPKGGAVLTDEQVRAVAAYVYSLRNKK
ncbi:MAG: c-type cytochrome [Gemmatimonadaceae bacterium]